MSCQYFPNLSNSLRFRKITIILKWFALRSFNHALISATEESQPDFSEIQRVSRYTYNQTPNFITEKKCPKMKLWPFLKSTFQIAYIVEGGQKKKMTLILR